MPLDNESSAAICQMAFSQIILLLTQLHHCKNRRDITVCKCRWAKKNLYTVEHPEIIIKFSFSQFNSIFRINPTKWFHDIKPKNVKYNSSFDLLDKYFLNLLKQYASSYVTMISYKVIIWNSTVDKH